MQKTLIICYYWPPAGGPGVQRWLKFVTYLSEFGIEPVVYCPKNPTYPILDKTLLSSVPEGITVLKGPINEPARWSGKLFGKQTRDLSRGIISTDKKNWIERLLLWIRGHFFIPDARIGWVKPSVSFLRQYLSDNTDIKTIITTGPPHSLHLIGAELQQSMSVKWMADFRDPWTQIHYHKDLNLSNWAKKKHEALERKILTAADHIVVTSPLTQLNFQTITDVPLTLITNGYDPVDFPECQPESSFFNMVHTGTLLEDRNPKGLWKALSTLIRDKTFKSMARLHLVGVVAPSIRASIKDYGLEDNVVLHGYVSHQNSLQWVVDAQLLLLIEMDKVTTKDILPGKIFEYLGASAKILALGPQDGVIKDIIDDTASGIYLGHQSYEEIKEFIANEFAQHQLGEKSFRSLPKAYQRKVLTQKMAELIKTL